MLPNNSKLISYAFDQRHYTYNSQNNKIKSTYKREIKLQIMYTTDTRILITKKKKE